MSTNVNAWPPELFELGCALCDIRLVGLQLTTTPSREQRGACLHLAKQLGEAKLRGKSLPKEWGSVLAPKHLLPALQVGNRSLVLALRAMELIPSLGPNSEKKDPDQDEDEDEFETQYHESLDMFDERWLWWCVCMALDEGLTQAWHMFHAGDLPPDHYDYLQFCDSEAERLAARLKTLDALMYQHRVLLLGFIAQTNWVANHVDMLAQAFKGDLLPWWLGGPNTTCAPFARKPKET